MCFGIAVNQSESGGLHCGDNYRWYESQGYHVKEEPGDEPHCRTGREQGGYQGAQEHAITWTNL